MALSDMMIPEQAQLGRYTPDETTVPSEVDTSPERLVMPWEVKDLSKFTEFAPTKTMGLIKDSIMGSPQPNESDPMTIAANHSIHPDSQGLIKAMDNGYADKKYTNIRDDIRDALKLGDDEKLATLHDKLTKIYLGEQSWADWHKDTFGGGQTRAKAQAIAGDIMMYEFKKHTGIGMPGVEESVLSGVIKPEEVLPGSQLARPGIPSQSFAYGSDGGEGMSEIQTLGMSPSYVPDARLTPQQETIGISRQHAISTGATYKAQAAATKSLLDEERAITEREKRKEIPARVAALKALTSLRNLQGDFASARVGYIKQLPTLRKELQGGNSPFELEALKRVHASISKHTPIDPADWAIWQRWLTKAQPQFAMDFIGNVYNKQTGKSSKGGTVVEMMGIATPPDTSLEPHEQAEMESGQNDILHQMGQMLGSLLQGSEEKKPESTADTKKLKGDSKSAPKVPAMTAAEKAELDALRKKHGR